MGVCYLVGDYYALIKESLAVYLHFLKLNCSSKLGRLELGTFF